MNGLAKLTYRAALLNACLFKRGKWIFINEDDQNNTEQRLATMKLAQLFLFLFRAIKLLHYDHFPIFEPKKLFLNNASFISTFERFLSVEYILLKLLPNDKNIYTNI